MNALLHGAFLALNRAREEQLSPTMQPLTRLS